MSDLISRQALINKAEYEAEAMQEPFKSQLPVLVAWLAEKIPSAQPEPLVKESRTLVKDLVKDAISRQAAIVQLSHNKTGDDDCDVVIQNDIETIKALPFAEPERKKGKWIQKLHRIALAWDCDPFDDYECETYDSKNHSCETLYWHCSECSYEASRSTKPLFKFCPECGADMRGEQDEND